MSQSEIKCPDCGKWTPGSREHCIFCEALVDPGIRDKNEREQRAKVAEQERIAHQSRFEKTLQKLKQSDHPFARFTFAVLNVVWVVYMAIISFIIWFTAIFSG